MKKKISILVLLVGATMVFSGCAKTDNTTIDKTDNGAVSSSANVGTESGTGWMNSCKSEKVSLPGYGDPGKRLKSCFRAVSVSTPSFANILTTAAGCTTSITTCSISVLASIVCACTTSPLFMPLSSVNQRGSSTSVLAIVLS